MTQIKYKSGVSDGASAIGHELNTGNSLATTGAKILSIKNAGVEKFFIDKDGNINTPVVKVVLPSEGEAGIKAAINTLNAAGGGIVQLLAGTYLINSTGIVHSAATIENVTLQGMGDSTILEVHSGTGFPSGYGCVNFFGQLRLNGNALVDTTVGDASVFCSIPANAGNVGIGDRVWVYGYTDGGYPDSAFLHAELHFAAANGNPTTGEIQLTEPILKTMGTVRVRATRGGVGNKLRNFKVIYGSGSVLAYPIYTHSTFNLRIENITISGFTSFVSQGIFARDTYFSVIDGCKISDMLSTGLIVAGQYNTISNNVFTNVHLTDSIYGGVIQHQDSYDCIWKFNTINKSNGCGITSSYGSGSFGIRNTYIGNNFFNVKYMPFNDTSSRGDKYIGNTIDTASPIGNEGYGIILSGCHDILVSENTIRNMYRGVSVDNASAERIRVVNNLIENMTGEGILYYSSSVGHVAANNTIKNCVTGIYTVMNNGTVTGNVVSGGTTGIRVEGDYNTVSDNTVQGTSSLGISIPAAADSNIIIGNNCKGCGITNSGTNNDLIGNKV